MALKVAIRYFMMENSDYIMTKAGTAGVPHDETVRKCSSPCFTGHSAFSGSAGGISWQTGT